MVRENNNSGCEGNCSSCQVPPSDNNIALSGAALVLSAAAVFLFPLALGIMAGILFRENPVQQTLGVVLGFVTGAFLVSVFIRFHHRRSGDK